MAFSFNTTQHQFSHRGGNAIGHAYERGNRCTSRLHRLGAMGRTRLPHLARHPFGHNYSRNCVQFLQHLCYIRNFYCHSADEGMSTPETEFLYLDDMVGATRFRRSSYSLPTIFVEGGEA